MDAERTSLKSLFRQEKKPPVERKLTLNEKRLIVHLGRMFSRQYDLQVLPSGQEGLWACSIDPKVIPEIERYINGDLPSLDHIDPSSLEPHQLLYDDVTLSRNMDLAQAIPPLRHEGGHARFTNFKDMFVGQRQATDEQHLATTFWAIFEGMEDPRVNILVGAESPTIDQHIRESMGEELKKRLSEVPIKNRPAPMQFAYNAHYQWLYGEDIPELKDTDVGKICQEVNPLLHQYFQTTDPQQLRLLQRQIWNITKNLESEEIQNEQLRQIHQNNQNNSSGNSPAENSPPDKEGPGSGTLKEFFKRLMSGNPKSEPEPQTPPPPKEGRCDLSKLSPEEIQELKKQLDQLPETNRERLASRARQAMDEQQKEDLEQLIPKSVHLEKDSSKGEYRARPTLVDKKKQQNIERDYQHLEEEIDQIETAESEASDQAKAAARQQADETIRQAAEKEQMQKAGFEDEEIDKFRLYQELENSIIGLINRFVRQNKDLLPQNLSLNHQGNFFSGPKINRRSLPRRLPVGDTRIYERPHLLPEGDPNLLVALVIDDTGSMEGVKTQIARMSTIFLAKVCHLFHTPFMATAFGESAEIVKSFEQDFENPQERIKPKLIDATNASGWSTNIHAGMETTFTALDTRLRRSPQSHGLIFVITDGGANSGLTGEDLKEFINSHKGRTTIIAIGLSENSQEREQIQEALNLYFEKQNCVYPEKFTDAPELISARLKTSFKHFKSLIT
ncbi:hypothetical protein A2397_05715 [Candidatus Amesbacteria bacterium RIFOXYB1_FULL_44_23]|uniref:VWFA domain-containing protein n=1 Tax=Candidatus Amesbacteria bacterium RIFOXYB1_FULL_44_23 TaxID=1797263 RepID=A0A1F4ZQW0_9BACT|nr:MAG: hypothetical protein A2397_05715 [Candidatus Amesbacteria bacterium RIFOXYB1_FULL_44_23]